MPAWLDSRATTPAANKGLDASIVPATPPWTSAWERPARGAGFRASSPGLLSGLSVSADLLNVTTDGSLKTLVDEGAPSKRAMTKTRSSGLLDGCGGTLDEAAFLEASYAVDSLIGDCLGLHQDFSGHPGSPKCSSPKSRNSALGGSRGSAEDSEKLRDRLEVYKMRRKVEPELPPLTALPVEEGMERLKPLDRMLILNASPEMLASYSIERRKERLLVRTKENRQRCELALSTRDESLALVTSQWSTALAKKRQQGVRALAKQRKAANVQTTPPMSQWFGMYCALAFAKELKSELDETKAIGSVAVRRGSKQAPVVNFAAFAEVELRRLLMLSRMVSRRMSVKRRKDKAKVVLECLQTWKVPGLFFMTCKRFMSKVVKVQRFWLNWAKWHHEAVAKLRKRWDSVEHGLLIKEWKGRNFQGPEMDFDLPWYCSVHEVPQDVKQNFIVQELRFLRYSLLPRIYLWEEETRRWDAKNEDLKSEKEAYKVVGAEADKPFWLWPPVRPSYMAPARTEEVILGWILTARKKPDGWRQLPKARQTPSAASKNNNRRSEEKEQSEASPFGEAPDDEELARWGALDD